MRHALTRILATALWLAGLLAAGFVLSPATAHAADADKATRQLQRQVQVLNARVAELEGDKARVEDEKAQAEKKAASHAAALPRAQAELKKAQAALAEAQAAHEAQAARVAELEKQLDVADRKLASTVATWERDVEQAFRQRDQRLSAVKTELQGSQGLVADCTGRNDRLLALNAELLTRWRSKGLLDVLRQQEPVAGLRDVEMFNLVQDYRDKAEADKFVPPVLPVPPVPPVPAVPSPTAPAAAAPAR